MVEEFDVLIVGFGMAGVCAALAAREAGASVLVLDRGHGGGASALSGGVVYSGGGTSHQKAAGYDDTPENMFRYLTQEVQGVVDDETLRRFCDESVDRLEWLEKHGASFDSSVCEYKTSYPTDRHYLYFSGNEKAYPYNVTAEPAPRGHRQVAPGLSSGHVLWHQLKKSALAHGVRFRPLSRVSDLVVENGVVAGVAYRSVDPGRRLGVHQRVAMWGAKFTNWYPPIGLKLNRIAERIWQGGARPHTVRARTVILSAGGFTFNRDMVRQFGPNYDAVRPLGTEGDDGTGIRLGQEHGGTVGCMDRMTCWRFMSPPSALLEGVSVGISGERMANEDLYGATHSELLVHKFAGKGFLVVDSETWRRAKAQVPDQAQIFQRAQLEAVFKSQHTRGDTVEELAHKLGVSASGLRATVDQYNDGILSGAGDPAHKAPDLCSPIVEPPFYAINISIKNTRSYPAAGLTLGGLRVEGTTGRLLDRDDQPIPGLYAAGRTAVGVCSNSYVSGLALADCVFSGKRAGAHAALASRTSMASK